MLRIKRNENLNNNLKTLSFVDSVIDIIDRYSAISMFIFTSGPNVKIRDPRHN